MIGFRSTDMLRQMAEHFHRQYVKITSTSLSDRGLRGLFLANACRCQEKGGEEKQLAVHHKLEEVLDQYLKATGLEKSRSP
jgi:hypothetical protein